MSHYKKYQEAIQQDIAATLSSKNCQPILFVGSGFTIRYANGLNWHGLLAKIAEMCPGAKPYEYYRQEINSPIDIGEKLADLVHQWAWGEGQEYFPNELFSTEYDKQVYIKQMIVNILNSTVEKIDLGKLSKEQKREIDMLRSIKPHAIATTNYDTILEKLFPDYEKIIGQQILKMDYTSVGEILKIHGCISKIDSLVLTRKDYDNFKKKQKYLSAKLLTYFAEHPLIFIGYSVDDPNIRSIISDIDEIISPENSVIPNIYIVKWDKNIDENSSPSYEQLIQVDEGRSVRIKAITSQNFDWIFESFASDSPLESVNPKILRSVLARTYELVRTDIPKRKVEVDFSTLTNAVTARGGVAKLFGISTLSNGADVNALYPYTASMIADKMGTNTHQVLKAIKTIESVTGLNIKLSDNQYHCTIKLGKSNTSLTHKYSEEGRELIEKAHLGRPLGSPI